MPSDSTSEAVPAVPDEGDEAHRHGLRRAWTYQAERFPVVKNGLLILTFSACAVAYSARLRGAESLPAWAAFGVAFASCFGFFLLLRIADEFKDAEEDRQFRPYRPVPRGLVTLRELGWAGAGIVALQIALAWWYEPLLLPVLAGVLAFIAVMSAEFFVRDWLKQRPVVYLLSHMLVVPLIDGYAAACDWAVTGSVPAGLEALLAASLCNGIVIELGRKVRQPADEEPGVETYSALWGTPRAVWVWWASVGAAAGVCVWAGMQVGFGVGMLVAGTVGVIAAGVVAVLVGVGCATGRLIETISGLWVLAAYVLLGAGGWLSM